MRKYPRFFLWFLGALLLLTILIDLPNFSIAYDSPTIPFLNKKISIHRTYPGFALNINFGNLHLQRDFPFKKGLDLEGGTSITLRADMKGVPQASRQDALDAAKIVVSNRVNLFGVSEPVIQTETINNDYRIIVDLPGVSSSDALKLIGTTAQLSFWEAVASGSANAASLNSLPDGITQTIGQYARKTDLTGKDLQNSAVTFDQNTGAPQVQLSFTPDGARKFADITKRNVGKIVAIVLDNQVIEAPKVNEPILDGNAVITGSFTSDTAKNLSIELQAGALPVPLSVLQQQSIGATLGTNALQKSLFAGILGFIIVVIFMCVLYGRLGFIASGALFLYTLLVLAIFKTIPVTLTLAGIAGFILSIGMAVDANILIFERMKEELRDKKSHNIAMELGFSRAWPSIRDSNISTLITSGILYQFGTGIVRGFAITLAIGVVISMFSAIVVTRTLLRVFYKE
ncbi:MAG: protein translocase subunit SecD [Candidatus Levyibacteriota bacterium]